MVERVSVYPPKDTTVEIGKGWASHWLDITGNGGEVVTFWCTDLKFFEKLHFTLETYLRECSQNE